MADLVIYVTFLACDTEREMDELTLTSMAAVKEYLDTGYYAISSCFINGTPYTQKEFNKAYVTFFM